MTSNGRQVRGCSFVSVLMMIVGIFSMTGAGITT